DVSRPHQRRGNIGNHGVSQGQSPVGDAACYSIGSTMTTKAADIRENYINAAYGVKSWLLTTDHKRIALLYLISVTLAFALGGMFAVLIRLELVTPAADLMSPDMYNRIFTLHGVVMVFFFLIPAVPATLGNFLVPMMIGAKDLAFPKLNLASWYVFMTGMTLTLIAIVTG